VHRLPDDGLRAGPAEHKVRVIAPDVGGGFGSKIYLYAERDRDGVGRPSA
jgi:CO/xanthine dehydrogenase Mo-binding subunit